MSKMKVILVLLVVAWVGSINAGGGEASCEPGVHFFQNYVSQIAEVDANTAKYFNLRYLSQEMKMQGTPRGEFKARLIKYTSSIDQLLGGIILKSVNAVCTNKASRLVFKIDDEGSIGKGDYIIVRLVEGKITNVSFEKAGVLLDGSEIQRLDYKGL